MNDTDLRVIKTRESIEKALLTLLAKKPLSKITIVELTREARINKSTFYLHFTDIFDLYHKTLRRKMEDAFEGADYFVDFFDDPKRFCEKLTASFTTNMPVMDILAQDAGTFFMLFQTLDLIRGKIYATGRIKPCLANDMRLDALFSALLVCRPRYEGEHVAEMDQLMLTMISQFKPDES